jgi:DNA-binding response OmpR family regulator
VLRRASRGATPDKVTAGDLVIHFERRLVMRGEEEIHLTKIEFGLLCELTSHPDTVLSYEHLLRTVWGAGYDDIRPVHVHICNLRRKIERSPMGIRYILPIPGVGYRFRMPD